MAEWQGKAELRELAYKLWAYETGQNLSEVHRRLNSDEYGFVISRKSLQEWKAKYDWAGRAARAEAEERSLRKATAADALIADLLRQKERYDAYLDGLPVGQIDTQAVYAYNGILKTLVAIQKSAAENTATDVDRPAVFMENLQFIATVLKEIDPEGLKALSANFDAITDRFKESLNA